MAWVLLVAAYYGSSAAPTVVNRYETKERCEAFASELNQRSDSEKTPWPRLYGVCVHVQ